MFVEHQNKKDPFQKSGWLPAKKKLRLKYPLILSELNLSVYYVFSYGIIPSMTQTTTVKICLIVQWLELFISWLEKCGVLPFPHLFTPKQNKTKQNSWKIRKLGTILEVILVHNWPGPLKTLSFISWGVVGLADGIAEALDPYENKVATW